jgi:hypothetical protein
MITERLSEMAFVCTYGMRSVSDPLFVRVRLILIESSDIQGGFRLTQRVLMAADARVDLGPVEVTYAS